MFFTKTETGRKLFKDHLRKLPIIELGGGFCAKNLAQDTPYENPACLLLQDPQKWRYMRAAGVDENFITGGAPPKEKFRKWCEAVERAVGSPAYAAAYLELESIFPGTAGHIGGINGDTAAAIWERTSEIIKNAELSPRKIAAIYNAEYIHCNVCPCDTDFTDFDTLNNAAISAASAKTAAPATSATSAATAVSSVSSVSAATMSAIPAKPTQYVPIYNASRLLKICGKREYLQKLSAAECIPLKDFESLKTIVYASVKRFAQHGCKIITAQLIRTEYDRAAFAADANTLLTTFLDKDVMTEQERVVYQTAILRALAEAAHEEKMILRLVLGQHRDCNNALQEKAGCHTGCGIAENITPMCGIADFFNCLTSDNVIPKIIVENADVSADISLATICGAFQFSPQSLPNIQQSVGGLCGTHNNRRAIKERLRTLSSYGYLAGSIGVTAETASLPALAHHFYFRSVLADFLGGIVERGEFTNDFKLLTSIAEDISYYNAKLYVQQ